MTLFNTDFQLIIIIIIFYFLDHKDHVPLKARVIAVDNSALPSQEFQNKLK